MNREVLFYGYFLIVMQFVYAWKDGYATQKQLRARGIMAYSLMEHGGWWSDIFIVTPIVAYVTKKYHLEYASRLSLLMLAVTLAVTVAAGHAYNKIGTNIPVPYSHDGKTPPAGWVHGIFAVAALWIMGMFYLTPINPPPSSRDLIGISMVLTPFFFLGIVDFNRRWVFLKGAKIQLLVQTTVLWIVTVIRLLWR